MLRQTFCFFNSLLEQQQKVFKDDRDAISDSEEASKGLETLDDRIASFTFLLVFSIFLRLLNVIGAEPLGQCEDLRVEPMRVPDVEGEVNRCVLVKRLFHVRLDSVVHGKALRLIGGAFVRVLRNIVTSVPNVQSGQVD